MKIAFHSNQIGLCGTEIALYDYAHHNETLLGNESIIVSSINHPWNHSESIDKFEKRFGRILWYQSFDEVDKLLLNENVDAFYAIKYGFRDGVMSKKCRNLIHCVFQVDHKEAHGDAYAYVSEWLCNVCSSGALPFVPHMVNLPAVNGDLRAEYHIPNDAIVFGRYGSRNTFDITFVHEQIEKLLLDSEKFYFLFMNTDHLNFNHPNIIYAKSTASLERKVEFINSCDAMIHARSQGESFGLAIAEFSSLNKPIITWHGSPERSHIEILGDHGIYYNNDQDLMNIFQNFTKHDGRNCYMGFSQEKVMNKFKNVFLDGLK